MIANEKGNSYLEGAESSLACPDDPWRRGEGGETETPSKISQKYQQNANAFRECMACIFYIVRRLLGNKYTILECRV